MRPDEAYVLVIEDDANNVLVITDLLRLAGVRYVNARSSGWQAIKLAESMPRVDLILLDIQLPYEDGYSVLAHIRETDKLRSTPVVAVTSNVTEEDLERARKAGFNGFIGKPLDFASFPHQIRALLNGEVIWIAHR